MKMDKKQKKLTWETMIIIEPKLQELYLQAKSYKKNSNNFCAIAVWYGYNGKPSMKDRVCELVGWDSLHPSLRNSKAYDMAYDKIYDELPDCSHNGECA
ncbi:MAG: hypothetical protein WCJ39_10825 [bacterium]